MKINEQSLKNELVSSIGKEIGGLGLYGQSKNAGLEVANQMSTIKKSLGEDETTEAMGAGSAGGYSQPLFSIKKKEVEEITKVEATEATGTASSGSYVTPSAWAKSTSKKDWRGKSKTQIPGGKFVQVKKKCKKFPYCNQGDMGALKLTNETVSDKVIRKLSERYGINESVIRDILNKHYGIIK
jgi:hypothetical protein